MKISAIQLDLAFDDPLQNEKKIKNEIEKTMEKYHPDTIVLPEMWNVSFFPDNIQTNADKDGKRTKAFLSHLSEKYRVNIVGGTVATVYEEKYYNTSYQFDREGNLIHTYHKVHLFSPSEEHNKFTAGNQLGIFELDGVKVGIATCYDLRFVEWIRLLALSEIEILFIPAAWPNPRVSHWETLLKARAIENQLFVVGVNSVGTTDKLTFCGHSLIVDPAGEVLASSNDNETILNATLDLEKRKTIKEQINVFKDRRPELYNRYSV